MHTLLTLRVVQIPSEFKFEPPPAGPKPFKISDIPEGRGRCCEFLTLW